MIMRRQMLMVAQPATVTYYEQTIFLVSLLFVLEFLLAFLFFVLFVYFISSLLFPNFPSYQIF